MKINLLNIRCAALIALSVNSIPSHSADKLIGNRYQITSTIGNTTETYTVVIDAAAAGGYYTGYLEGYDVRVSGPKTGSQICMTTEALFDTAFTFCFNGTIRNDKKAFTTVTTWDTPDGERVYLYSDVYRAAVLRYKLTPTSVKSTYNSADNNDKKIERSVKALEALESTRTK